MLIPYMDAEHKGNGNDGLWLALAQSNLESSPHKWHRFGSVGPTLLGTEAAPAQARGYCVIRQMLLNKKKHAFCTHAFMAI